MEGVLLPAVLCLMLCGFVDCIDGRIARACKRRSRDEKRFGVQIDSLCDLIAFGLLPGIIGFSVGLDGVLGIAVVCIFVLAALVRLAYFNVRTAADEESSDSGHLSYVGLPVTAVSLLIPLLCLFHMILPQQVFIVCYGLVLLGTAMAFVWPFTMKKPGLKKVILMIACGAVLMAALLIIYA